MIAFIFAIGFFAFQNSNSAGIAGVVKKVKLNSDGSDTVSNSMSKTGYLEFDTDKIIDSVQFVQYGIGELDVDQFIPTKVFVINDAGYKTYKSYSTVAGDTSTLTTNLDSAVSSVTWIKTWTGANLTGANAIHCRINAASSGNDAGDPNTLQLYGIIFYRPE